VTEAQWLLSGEPGPTVCRAWRGYVLHFDRFKGKHRAFFGATRNERTYGGQGATKREALRKARRAIDSLADDRDLFLMFATRARA